MRRVLIIFILLFCVYSLSAQSRNGVYVVSNESIELFKSLGDTEEIKLLSEKLINTVFYLRDDYLPMERIVDYHQYRFGEILSYLIVAESNYGRIDEDYSYDNVSEFIEYCDGWWTRGDFSIFVLTNDKKAVFLGQRDKEAITRPYFFYSKEGALTGHIHYLDEYHKITYIKISDELPPYMNDIPNDGIYIKEGK